MINPEDAYELQGQKLDVYRPDTSLYVIDCIDGTPTRITGQSSPTAISPIEGISQLYTSVPTYCLKNDPTK